MKKLLILLTCLLLGQGLYAQTDRDIKAAEKKEEADRKAAADKKTAQRNWRDKYDEVSDSNFGNEVNMIMKNNKWGIATKNGRILIPCKYEMLIWFGFDSPISAQLHNKWGEIDIRNKIITPFIYESAGWVD